MVQPKREKAAMTGATTKEEETNKVTGEETGRGGRQEAVGVGGCYRKDRKEEQEDRQDHKPLGIYSSMLQGGGRVKIERKEGEMERRMDA